MEWFTLKYIIAVLVGYLLSVYGGHLFVRLILRKYRYDMKNRGLKSGGAMIGYLERAIIFTLLLLNASVIIGLVLTAKSIARFEDLKKREFAEYFLIGTLSSIFFPFLVFLLLRPLL